MPQLKQRFASSIACSSRVGLNDFVLRAATARRRQHRLLHARELREVRHVHPGEIGDDVDRDHALLQRLVAQDLVEVERDALAVADGVDDHQRLPGSELDDVAGGEELGVAEASEPIDLDRAALGLELIGQPLQRRVLADGDDHVVDRELSAGRLLVDRDRRRVDGAA